MSAFLAWIVKYLPMILSLLSTLGGLVSTGGAVASHFHLQNLHQQAVAKGMSAAPELSSAFMSHVVGQGAGGATLLLAAIVLAFGQGHASQAFAALDEKKSKFNADLAKFQALLERQKTVAEVTDQVHALPIPDATKLFDKIGGNIADVLAKLTGK